jgi:predicted metalloprotease with PDZ domain
MIHARSWRSLIVFGVTWILPAAVFSQADTQQTKSSRQSEHEQVRYTVSLAGYRSHLLHIEMQLPAGEAVRTVLLPVWNAVYQIRDFAQYVNWEKVKSPGGQALPIHQLDKTTWRVEGAQDGAVIEYEVFADQSGPYGAQVNAHHAFFNLAEILMYVVDGRAWGTDLAFTDVPPGWKFGTALEGENAPFHAANYDRLVDSPVEIGTFDEADFDEGGGHYRVIVDADKSDYDLQHIVADLRKIVASETEWMKDRPFQTYVFLYHLQRHQGGGGMEHAYSTAIDLNPESLKNTLEVLDIVSAHEFFHLWNVKRIRPQSLEPVDYTKENYTRALWFSEGVTSTVEGIALFRAGLLSEHRYLQILGEQISYLEDSPARRSQSAEESSLDVWLERYPYYSQPQRSISYYNVGELLGLTLDLSMREKSDGKACLRDLFQWMNQNYAKQGKFFPDSQGVAQAAEAVAHADFSGFFHAYVSGVEEIPWDDFFRDVGLHVIRNKVSLAEVGFVAGRNFDGPPTVTQVEPGSEAEKAGLASGDVLLEINGHEPTVDFERKLQQLHSGDALQVHVRGENGDRKLQWKVGVRENVEFELRDVENLSPQQKSRRAAWLRGECTPVGDARP